MNKIWILIIVLIVILSFTSFLSFYEYIPTTPKSNNKNHTNHNNTTPPPVCNLTNITVVTEVIQEVYVEKPSLRKAVCTLLTSEDYLTAARTLGYSIKKTNTKAEMFAYVVDTISPKARCLMEDAGWKIKVISVVPPPAQPYFRFKDMFTKLLFWNTTQYDVLVYLDSDMIALLPFDEVFDSPAQFSAVGDYFDHSFTDKFNAGFFVLRPNEETYKDIMSKIHDKSKYDTVQAEQGFLNYYYQFSHVRLPYRYNGNLAIYEREPAHIWDRLNVVTIHYTLYKPWSEINERDPNIDPIFKLWFKYRDEMLAVATKKCDAVQ